MKNIKPLALIVARITRMHALWKRAHQKRVGLKFNPTFFRTHGARGFYDHHRDTGRFAQALAACPSEVRRAWKPQIFRLRKRKDEIAAIIWHHAEWQRLYPHGEVPWCRRYLDSVDTALTHKVDAGAEHLDRVVASIGGAVASDWVATKRRPRCPRKEVRHSTTRSVRVVQKLFRMWCRDRKHGRGTVQKIWNASRNSYLHLPSRFGFRYVVSRGEGRTYCWMVRHRVLTECLRRAGPEIERAWYHKSSRLGIGSKMRVRRRPAPLAVVRSPKPQPASPSGARVLKELQTEDPRTRGAMRMLKQWGIAVPGEKSRRSKPTSAPTSLIIIPERQRFGTMGGRKPAQAPVGSARPDWEEEEEQTRRGPIGSIDEALDELAIS